MSQAADHLKASAAQLHKSLRAHSSEEDSSILKRLSLLPEFRGKELDEVRKFVQRKHFLTMLARERGMSSWRTAKCLFEGKYPPDGDFGTFLYPHRCAGFLNEWLVDHAEALVVRKASAGYLLPYRQQFMVVTSDYVSSLGIDPCHPGWEEIQYDWTVNRISPARAAFYDLILAQERGLARGSHV